MPTSKSLLWARLDLDGTVKHLQDDPSLKNFSKDILVQQTRTYNVLYKPTFVYPHAKFWGEANEPIFNWLYELKRIQRPLKAADFEQFGRRALSWRRPSPSSAGRCPKTPPFLPAGWKGSLAINALSGLRDAAQSERAADHSRTRVT